MKRRILFVCLGNICRSPLAEAIFKHKIRQMNMDSVFDADSCGTSDYHVGDTPDPRTVENAVKNGIKIDHFGRQLSEEDFEMFDMILAMDSSNYRNILKLPSATRHLSKIALVRIYDPQGLGDVPDPYYGGETGFQNVFDILNRSIDGLLADLTN